MSKDTRNVAVIGLGYVGLPLAAEFGKKYRTVGFDINAKRIDELRQGRDLTREMSPAELAEAKLLEYTSDPAEIADLVDVTEPGELVEIAEIDNP